MTQLDKNQLRRVLGSFLTGVTVVTTADKQKNPLGFTANSFTSVSLDPPLVLVCIAKSSYNCDQFQSANGFAVNILSAEQQNISATFASPVKDRFADINWFCATTGNPIIDNCTAWLDCQMEQIIEAGDHLILLGRVVSYDSQVSSPLGYLRGNYVSFALEQEAASALENPHQTTCVGAILECQDKLLLIDDKEGDGLHLPFGARLGSESDEQSLLGLLRKQSISVRLNSLYALYENSNIKTLSIYYRGEVLLLPGDETIKLYALSDIPYERLNDSAVCAMLKRYVEERSYDAFGIYVGDDLAGDVEHLNTAKTE